MYLRSIYTDSYLANDHVSVLNLFGDDADQALTKMILENSLAVEGASQEKSLPKHFAP